MAPLGVAIGGVIRVAADTHLIAIYHLHRAGGPVLRVTPFLDTEERGVFATRAPRRPNPVGLSVLRITGVQDGVVRVENVDMLDGTPVLDIKPYVPDFDVWPVERIGWCANRSGRAETITSDGRFVDPGNADPPPSGQDT